MKSMVISSSMLMMDTVVQISIDLVSSGSLRTVNVEK